MQYIFDVAIYRCSFDQCHKEFDRDLQKHYRTIWPSGTESVMSQGHVLAVEEDFRILYGLPWQFNNIIGWIRLHVLGMEIRGEVWKTDAKKLVRRPKHKRFISASTDAFRVDCRLHRSPDAIFQTVIRELELVTQQQFGKRAYLDLECLKNIGPHINWQTVCPVDRTLYP